MFLKVKVGRVTLGSTMPLRNLPLFLCKKRKYKYNLFKGGVLTRVTRMNEILLATFFFFFFG